MLRHTAQRLTIMDTFTVAFLYYTESKGFYKLFSLSFHSSFEHALIIAVSQRGILFF